MKMLRDLKINYEFKMINIDDLTKENIRHYFYFVNQEMAFVSDKQQKLYGIVTLNDLLDAQGDVCYKVKQNFLSIKLKTVDEMLLEAEQIYNEYNLKTYIPIINDNNRMIGYIYDDIQFRKKINDYELLIKKIKTKMICYKSSYYMRKEIKAFFEILNQTCIYIKKCVLIDELDLFSNENYKLKIFVLNKKEFYNKLETEKDKTTLFLDFTFNQYSCLFDALYTLEKFWNEFSKFVDEGEYTRILRITNNPYYSLYDFIEDYDLKEIAYPKCSIITKFLSDYFDKNLCQYVLDNMHLKHGIRASWLVNKVRSSEKVFHSFSTCDMIGQQILLNKKLHNKNIKILNVLSAMTAELTKGEKRRFETFCSDLSGLVENKDEKSINELYGNDYGEKASDCAKKLIYSYPVMRRFEQDILVNVDYNSTYINFENGVRKTFYQPDFYNHTIFVLGPCLALGSFVEDKYTIPSLLSKKLNENNFFYRVINLGIAASNDIQEVLNNLDIHDGDIIINLMSAKKNKVKNHIDIIETSEAFNRISERSDMFFDMPLHCNHQGNEVYAKVIYKHIKEYLKVEDILLKKCNVFDIYKTNTADLDIYEFKEYMNLLTQEKNKVPKEKAIIGSIVMNANPFTLGHEYLIDYALKQCDWLYLFVVQENQSFFHFTDRFRMISEGCREKKNICILPSGKLIISDITFPEYFQREISRDNTDIEWNIKINTVLDFRLYANYIAPKLGITKRFVGEEPLDSLTRQYNENMKKVLSVFNIEVIEVPRKTLKNGDIINASYVRALYKEKEFNKLKAIVPGTTLEFLISNTDKYLV